MNEDALLRCEQEALHLSGAIQPHGALLIASAQRVITHASTNIDAFLGLPVDTLIGMELPAELAQPAARLSSTPGRRLHCENILPGARDSLDAVLLRTGSGAIQVELGFHQRSSRSVLPAYVVEPPPVEFGSMDDVNAAMQELVREVAELTGAARVLYYAFRHDDDGEVLAEFTPDAGAGRYQGLRFPASDIPQIARQLYLRNPWRLIPDRAAVPVPIAGAATAAPPDLTYSDLRSVSPVHLIYMGNMGVCGSLSVPVPIGGRLAALVTAHSSSPLLLPLRLLDHLAMRVSAHANALAAWQACTRVDALREIGAVVCQPWITAGGVSTLGARWPEAAAWLTTEFGAHGAVLLGSTGGGQTHGQCPALAALADIDRWFTQTHAEATWSTERLPQAWPHGNGTRTTGLLAARIVARDGSVHRLYLLRNELVHEVAWGGRPDKPVVSDDGVTGLSPRTSFERWVERRTGYCAPWTSSERLKLLQLQLHLQRQES